MSKASTIELPRQNRNLSKFPNTFVSITGRKIRSLYQSEGRVIKGELSVNAESRARVAGSFVVEELDQVSASGREESARMQEMKYKILKRLNLPVVPTFRVDNTETKIVTTDVSRGGKSKIYTNNNPMPSGVKNKLLRQNPNFITDIRTQALEIADTAYSGLEENNTRKGVFLSIDAYALAVDEFFNPSLYLLDLGMGSHIIDPVSETEILSGSPLYKQQSFGSVEDFIAEVILGYGNPENIFFGG